MYLFGFFRRIQYSKKQPPDTFLISDGCFALLYFIPQLFCCHVALCLNFALFAALPLLVYSFDSAKVKLICIISAWQIYYLAVVVDGVDTVKACLIEWEIIGKVSCRINTSADSIWLYYANTKNFPRWRNCSANRNMMWTSCPKVLCCSHKITWQCPVKISWCR